MIFDYNVFKIIQSCLETIILIAQVNVCCFLKCPYFRFLSPVFKSFPSRFTISSCFASSINPHTDCDSLISLSKKASGLA